MNTDKQLILILGVTASGKGRLGFELAKTLGGEIISIDSMKVYRRMDIGTAKPPIENRRQIPHHLIDVVEPWESFSVDKYLDLAYKAIESIRSRNRPVIAVGGTAMYIKALLYGIFEGTGCDERIRERLKKQAGQIGLEEMHKRLAIVDSQAAMRIHHNDERRIIRALEVYELTGRPISDFQTQFDAPQPQINWRIIGIRRQKDEESKRINARVKKMIEQGLADEVRSLLTESKPLSKQAAAAIGYAEMIRHIKGELDLEETIELIKKNTRRFAKAQRTWFKTFRSVNWIDIVADTTLETVLSKALKIVDDTANIG